MNYVPEENTIYPNIAVSTQSGVVFLQESEILYCEADGSYTHIHLEDVEKSKLTVAKPLRRVLETLCETYFVRIHHSYAINLLHAVSFNGVVKNCVSMTNGENIAVSRSRKEAFLKRFKVL